jgi:hypothetical protein
MRSDMTSKRTVLRNGPSDGEYWFEGSYVVDASGMGDYDHMAYSMQSIISHYDLGTDDEELEEIQKRLDDEVEAVGGDLLAMAGKRGIPPDDRREYGSAVAAILGLIDARDFAIEYWAWKRYADGSIQTHTLTQADIDMIANGLYEVFGDDPVGETFDVEVNATHAFYVGVPWEVLSGSNPLEFENYRR